MGICEDVLDLYKIEYKEAKLEVKNMIYQMAKDHISHTKNILHILSVFHTHERLLSEYIYKGYTFGKMDFDPVASSDEKHGIPPLWAILLGETLEKQEKMMGKMDRGNLI